jgi:hypothetical protein
LLLCLSSIWPLEDDYYHKQLAREYHHTDPVVQKKRPAAERSEHRYMYENYELALPTVELDERKSMIVYITQSIVNTHYTYNIHVCV